MAIWIFGLFVSALIPSVFKLVDAQKNVEMQSETISMTSIVSLKLSQLIKSSYWINFNETITTSDLDSISLYTDKYEKWKVKIYVEQDLDRDLSRLMYKFNSNDPRPLHTTKMFIKSFNIETTVDPKLDLNYSDIIPWVKVKLLARSRSPLEIPDDLEKASYQKVNTSITWRWIIRNYTPYSLKQ